MSFPSKYSKKHYVLRVCTFSVARKWGKLPLFLSLQRTQCPCAGITRERHGGQGYKLGFERVIQKPLIYSDESGLFQWFTDGIAKDLFLLFLSAGQPLKRCCCRVLLGYAINHREEGRAGRNPQQKYIWISKTFIYNIADGAIRTCDDTAECTENAT